MTRSRLAELIRQFQEGQITSREFARACGQLGVSFTMTAFLVHTIKPAAEEGRPKPPLHIKHDYVVMSPTPLGLRKPEGGR